MGQNFAVLPEPELLTLDELLAAEQDGHWQSFYCDRTRPCPFFVSAPDENLVVWSVERRLPGGSALDIGCGNARNSIFLAQQGFAVLAVDYSATAIAWAREAVAEMSVAVEVVHSSIFSFPLRPEGFDFIYDSGCFHHVAPHRRHQYTALVSCALKPGGLFGLVCFTPEGGSGFGDEQVYDRRSLGGGLGYSEESLRAMWSPTLEVQVLRRMHDHPAESSVFGKGFLWAMLARKQ
jgi:SAM-dependent methyltransferase